MKRSISTLTLVLLLGLFCFNPASADIINLDTSNIDNFAQISEDDLARRFNADLDKELSGDNVCVTPSAARRLSALMTASAAKIIRGRLLERIPEAEKNVTTFAKALVAQGANESGRVRITSETINNVMNATANGEEPPSGGGGAGENLRKLFCPLFPIC